MDNNNDFPSQVNFGFSKVSFEQKRDMVRDIFSSVANEYDVMNDLMSLGIHRLWKDQFVRQIPNLASNILDVASGTGDIAFRIIKRAKEQNILPQVTLCDINLDMLTIARNKAVDSNILHGLEYVVADAEKLPFPDNSFDCYTIAFGIRNVSKIDNALKEAYRVLKPKGKFLCLEFSKMQYEGLKQLYQFYSFNIIPKIGKIVANNEAAYQYLVESISLFPDQENFAIMLKDAGFNDVSYKNLHLGIAAIHSGYK
ncbi:bifunctional demethylmenaquinone methyltransferase/2-methoxy-6-polyprenyl-1,4-benzoquinol methylase UbiE [Candidatus Tisiphia endosymbiont of Ptychoptera albimana]|uniref:bifunctional demethylmenaquinone methyltransferase/2-methoxy-6-polyprenyl-1,4-benzoquinol methylase UbiE n=1 Tax=Candidatus Tisiphia endosymbiont of Ptychoptera albimana TaxID=3066260 RepID=UPI001D3A2FDF|nr:bifunctional demethylmenaquinone methyltransferase/2-methoxy-6-polyprenyl-1,4-benzoquinol methylase UbiE [Rickettsia endosymbiont of Sericostoma sp. HW-2014]